MFLVSLLVWGSGRLVVGIPLFARQGYGSHQIANVALKVVDSLFLVQQRIADVIGVGVATLQVVELPLNILDVPSI